MTDVEIINRIKDDIKKGTVKVVTYDTYRAYSDGTHEVVMEETGATLKNYYNTFIAPGANQTTKGIQNDPFLDLPRCTIYVGPPDTGKTYSAIKFMEDNNIPYVLIMGRPDLTLETLLEDFKLIDGKPAYVESLVLKYLSGTDKCGIIIDEFNTIRTGDIKTLQPLLDTTSKQFEFKGKVYNKNMNCKFICTLNDKDKGISVLPDAILSRCAFKYFDPVNVDTLNNWSGLDKQYIKNVADIFNLLELQNVFGTRQLDIISKFNTVDEISNHLIGLLALRNKDFKLISTVEVQTRLSALCNMKRP